MEKKKNNKNRKKVIIISTVAIILVVIILIILLTVVIRNNIAKKYSSNNESIICSYTLYSDYMDMYNSSIIEFDNKNIINRITEISNIEVFDDEEVDINKLFNEQKKVDNIFSKVDGLTKKTIMPDENTLYVYEIRDLKRASNDYGTEKELCKKNSELCSNDFDYSYGITVNKYISYLKKLVDTYNADVICK